MRPLRMAVVVLFAFAGEEITYSNEVIELGEYNTTLELAQYDFSEAPLDPEVKKKKKKKRRKKKRRRKRRRRKKRAKKRDRQEYRDSASSTWPKSGHIGLLGGMSAPSLEGTEAQPSLGISGAYLVGDHVLLGVFVNSWMQITETGTVKSTAILLPFGLEGNFFYQGFKIGPRFGLLYESVSTDTASATDTDLIYGGQAGYDFLFSDSCFSLGVEVSYTFVQGEPQEYQMLNGYLAGKYWF